MECGGTSTWILIKTLIRTIQRTTAKPNSLKVYLIQAVAVGRLSQGASQLVFEKAQRTAIYSTWRGAGGTHVDVPCLVDRGSDFLLQKGGQGA
jgi:hypothetical protein